MGCTKDVPAPETPPGTEAAPAGGAVGDGATAAFVPAAREAAAHGAGDIIARNGNGTAVEQAAGCGGFGKGNFGALFLSIEEYERTLNV